MPRLWCIVFVRELWCRRRQNSSAPESESISARVASSERTGKALRGNRTRLTLSGILCLCPKWYPPFDQGPYDSDQNSALYGIGCHFRHSLLTLSLFTFPHLMFAVRSPYNCCPPSLPIWFCLQCEHSQQKTKLVLWRFPEHYLGHGKCSHNTNTVELGWWL